MPDAGNPDSGLSIKVDNSLAVIHVDSILLDLFFLDKFFKIAWTSYFLLSSTFTISSVSILYLTQLFYCN